MSSKLGMLGKMILSLVESAVSPEARQLAKDIASGKKEPSHFECKTWGVTMTLEDLDELVRELLTKIRELKLDLLLGNNKIEEDLHKALELTDEI